ncbi:MAG: hypothetical protein KatS3mg057_2622 [Herpetosiphonaceae bacterium]|nr:MAG: hypothetical protein KatS3mg057_2622 [Herpetosiphonaceae bacterium]
MPPDVLVIPDTVTDVTASPLKLFEYLAAGRMVVLPDIPALAEILPYTVGLLFPGEGIQPSLADALCLALADPDRSSREALGRAAVQEHTYAARAVRILGLAESVVKRCSCEKNGEIV